MPYLSLYLKDYMGANFLNISFSFAFYALPLFLLEIPTGGVADIIGRKKLFNVSQFIVVISFIILLIPNFYCVLIFQFLSGVGRALNSGSLEAWAIDSLKDEDDSKIEDLFRTIVTYSHIAAILGIILGSLLMSNFFFDASHRLFQINIWGGIIFSSIALIISMFFQRVDNKGKYQSIKITAMLKDVKNDIKQSPKIIVFLMFGLFFAVYFNSIETFWQPFLKERIVSVNYDYILIGIVGSIAYIVGIIFNLLSSKIKFKSISFLVSVKIILGLLLSSLSFVNTQYSFVIFYASIYGLVSVVDPIENTLFNNLIKSDRRATFISIKSCFSYLGILVGLPLLGLIGKNNSLKTLFAVSGMIFVISSTIIYLLRHVFKKNK